MKYLKIQTVIMALVLVTIPFLRIQDAQAFTKWKVTYGTNISLERQEVVAKGDKVILEAKNFKYKDADSYTWNWDICGVKLNTTTSTWYTKKTFTFNKVGNCIVKVDGAAYYDGDPNYGIPTGGIAYPGFVSDTVKVLPSEISTIYIKGPESALKGQTFWLESSYIGPFGYNNLNWTWKASGACKGSSESMMKFTKIGETGDKAGVCTMNLDMRVEYPNKVVKGSAVKYVSIK